MENKDKPRQVSAFEHENALWHYGNVNRRSMINQITMGITVIIIVVSFIVAYTIREQRWINTLVNLVQPTTEAHGDGVHEQPYP